jgi:hypothetical protein
MEFKNGIIFSKKKFSKKGKRKTYPTIVVNIYRTSDFKKINEVDGIKSCGEKYNIDNMPYIINKNKGKELKDCYSVNGIIFKTEDTKIF